MKAGNIYLTAAPTHEKVTEADIITPNKLQSGCPSMWKWKEKSVLSENQWNYNTPVRSQGTVARHTDNIGARD